jgi:4'-phosphopantetheinyl transferase
MELPAERSIDVWLRPPDVQAMDSGYWETLSKTEKERACRFQFQNDRKRYTESHGFLRQVLAVYCNCQPVELEFDEGPYGKPLLTFPEGLLEFNISHSGGCTLIGVTRQHACGVDIERLRQNVAITNIVSDWFSPEERRLIDSVPADHQIQTFFRIWTMKEAVVKAMGAGMSVPLNEVKIHNTSSQVVHVKCNGLEKSLWCSSLDLLPNFRSAVAIDGSEGYVRLLNR